MTQPREERGKRNLNPLIHNDSPAIFKRRTSEKSAQEAVTIPMGGEKTILFDTDVANNYFDRIEEPGELKIAILNYKVNETEGGNAPGKVERIEDVFNVRKSSPQDGTIKIHLNPKETVNVGDEARIKVSLTGPTEDLEDVFWVKISEPKSAPEPSTEPKEREIPTLGLPELAFAYQHERPERNGELTWEQVAEATGEDMDFGTVMYPMVNGEKLERVYINMDSTVLKNFHAKE